MTQLLSQHHGRWQIGANENITWRTAESFTKGCALVLSVDSEPQLDWVEADLIGIEFPAFTDGRGLSLAVLLRQRVGFTGDLRALGAVQEDVLHFMLRCGFTSFALSEDRDPHIVLAQLAPYSQHYQASARQHLSSLVRLRD